LIHPKVGETNFPDMLRQIGFNRRSTGYQNHLVSGQCPGDFKAAEKMADTQDMLTILDNFHGISFWVQRFRVLGSEVQSHKRYVIL
jgi:hypothetical protein